jgi:molybdopterin molybdotransferase
MDSNPMLPEEAQQSIVSTVAPAPAVLLPVSRCRRSVLARAVLAPRDLPAFAQSAVDGYALASGGGVQPGESFRLTGVSRAGGALPAPLSRGEAMRIYTGAPVPAGTTVILMQEVARADDAGVEVLEAVPEGKFIRPIGGDVPRNAEALSCGTVVGPAAFSLLQALGIREATVYRSPRVAVVASGDELSDDAASLRSGQVLESSSAGLRWALEEEGLELGPIRFAKDDVQAHERELREALESADFLLVTGGVSVGDFDLVRPALEKLGVEQVFWRVKQRPGGPLYFGCRGDRYVFGLPGNPASTLVCFYQHVLPALRRFRGYADPFLTRVRAALIREFRKPAALTHFVRARLLSRDGELTVQPDPQQESHTLRSFAAANALAVLPAGREHFPAGEAVSCDLLPGGAVERA